MSTSPGNASQPDAGAIRDAAIDWIVRQDRGLSTEEKVEFERWLEADPRHAEAFEHSSHAWSKLRLPVSASPSAGRPAPLRWLTPALAGTALAAMLTLAARWPNPVATLPPPIVATASATPHSHTLPDGSLMRLNAGAAIASRFSREVRRIAIVRGEAYFVVTKDPARPFVVDVGEVQVRAVGTAFSIHRSEGSVSVIVTEGTVSVGASAAQRSDREGDSAKTGDVPILVSAGHRAIVSASRKSGEQPVTVSPVTAFETAQLLAWREPLIEFGGASLATVARQFAQKTGRRIEIADHGLEQLQVGGSFPAGDLDGFIQLLEENYGVAAARRPDGTLVLRKAP